MSVCAGCGLRVGHAFECYDSWKVRDEVTAPERWRAWKSQWAPVKRPLVDEAREYWWPWSELWEREPWVMAEFV